MYHIICGKSKSCKRTYERYLTLPMHLSFLLRISLFLPAIIRFADPCLGKPRFALLHQDYRYDGVDTNLDRKRNNFYINPIFCICSFAAGVVTRPRGVRLMNPICIRKGSYTSSMVSVSSLTLTASVSAPTGPPP